MGHSNDIIHRDLKMENLLYESTNSDRLKLIDFGFAKHSSVDMVLTESWNAVLCRTRSAGQIV